jgi:threonine/homoserine/homoserine lactone efflux protein
LIAGFVYLYLSLTTGDAAAMSALSITLGPLLLFCLVASITPGPNNLLLMRSGAAFGIRRSVGHMMGIQLGCAGLLLLCYLGIGAMLLALPAAFALLHWACFAYLLWLAAMIFRDGRAIASPGGNAGRTPPGSRPMQWYEASLFQLINPKAWMMAITMASAFYGSKAPGVGDIALATLAWISVGTPSMLAWTIWGASIERVLQRPRERQVYACSMSLAVAATAIWMLR